MHIKSVCIFLNVLELKKAPVLNSVTVKNSTVLKIQWRAPDTDKYTGKITYFEICYFKSKSISCSFVSVESSLVETAINGLQPNMEYKIKIRAVVALGHGPYSNNVTATTLEAG